MNKQINIVIKNTKIYLKERKINSQINAKKVSTSLLNTVFNYIEYKSETVYIHWYYSLDNMKDSLTRLAHEIGHVLLNHHLIKPDPDDAKRYPYEKAAWEKAIEVADHFNWEFNKDVMKKILSEYK